MPTLEFTVELDAPLKEVWDFHDTIETLFRLTPPDTQIRLEGEPEPMCVGVVYKLRMRRWGIVPLAWDAEIMVYEPPCRFVDRQIPGKGPFRFWEHQHEFTAISRSRTRLTDRVAYEMPFGWLGKLADGIFVRRDIERMFAHRHRVTREALTGSASLLSGR